MPVYLTATMVKEIKEKIWDGYPQIYVAEEYLTTQGTISRIVNGHVWAEVPWPDGSRGSMSINRRTDLHRQRLEKVPSLVNAPPREKPVEIGPIALKAAQIIEEMEEQEYLRRDQEIVNQPYVVPKREKEKPISLKFDPAAWQELLETAPDNPYVKQASEGDEVDKFIILQTFSALPQSAWEGDLVPIYLKAARDALLNLAQQSKK